MRIGVIGGGISGLAVGRLLGERHDVEILEKGASVGGIAKTRVIDGVPFHMVGGHCFNSKNKEVLDFVFSKVLPESDWHKVVREARIWIRGLYLNYPIELNIRQLIPSEKMLVVDIARDFLSAKGGHAENLESWFRMNFGNALAELYFIPYNQKIWGRSPSDMRAEWVHGKLPTPDKVKFIEALSRDVCDEMPHSTFYYPNANNQYAFIEALAAGQKIVSNYPVARLEKNGARWLINGERSYDAIISTGPLNELPGLLVDAPTVVHKAAANLRYNKITTAFWRAAPQKATWTYYPEPDIPFHRAIHIGNFLLPQRADFTITESVGIRNKRELLEGAKKLGYLDELLDFHVSDHAYVVFDDDYATNIDLVTGYAKSVDLHVLGRFGEWKYHNMDVCIESAMRLVRENFGES